MMHDTFETCYGCPFRREGCHGKCEGYQARCTGGRRETNSAGTAWRGSANRNAYAGSMLSQARSPIRKGGEQVVRHAGFRPSAA